MWQVIDELSPRALATDWRDVSLPEGTRAYMGRNFVGSGRLCRA